VRERERGIERGRVREREGGWLNETRVKERNIKETKCVTFNTNAVVDTHNTNFCVLL
jgi:hypothetical protein